MAELSPLRRRMIEDMTVRNLSPATQRCYLHAVSKFSRFFMRSPDRLDLEDVRTWQVHLVSQGISWASLNQFVAALRFFYGVTLRCPEIPERITYARQPRRLPVVLSADEVVRFLEAVPSLKNRTALTHGLCRRAAGIGGGGAQAGRHRQRPDGDPGRAGQTQNIIHVQDRPRTATIDDGAKADRDGGRLSFGRNRTTIENGLGFRDGGEDVMVAVRSIGQGIKMRKQSGDAIGHGRALDGWNRERRWVWARHPGGSLAFRATPGVSSRNAPFLRRRCAAIVCGDCSCGLPEPG